MKKNAVIYDEAKKNKVYLWQVARKIGIADTTLSKKMRQELSQIEKDYILEIIRNISNENSTDDGNCFGGRY